MNHLAQDIRNAYDARSRDELERCLAKVAELERLAENRNPVRVCQVTRGPCHPAIVCDKCKKDRSMRVPPEPA